MRRHERQRREQFHGEVAVAHGVHGVLRHRIKAEQRGDVFTVEDDGGAGNRSAAEREDVQPFPRIHDPAAIAVEHFDVCQQVMREKDRLCALEMRVAGDDHFQLSFAELHERALQLTQAGDNRIALIAQIKPDIGRHLIVSRTRRVQLRTSGSDAARQLRLDVHVDVFELDFELKLPRLDLRAYFAEPGDDLRALLSGKKPRPLERGAMGDGALDVVTPEPPVKADAFTEGLK